MHKTGLKVYNAADVNNLQLIKQLNDGIVYDVIAENGLAIVVAGDGFTSTIIRIWTIFI